MVEVWGQGNISFLDEICSNNFVYFDLNEFGSTSLDLISLKKYISDLHAVAPGFKINLVDSIQQDDKIALRCVVEGVSIARYDDITAAGNVVMILQICESKISHSWVLSGR